MPVQLKDVISQVMILQAIDDLTPPPMNKMLDKQPGAEAIKKKKKKGKHAHC